jgi:hypothetical protein
MISHYTLLTDLGSNVLEVKFNRRRPKKNVSPTRRMLCTLDYGILNSEKGLSILNFKAPANASSYNTKERGLVTAWDILMQDWRTINTESCNIITKIPTSPEDDFWDYFNNNILTMSAAQKAAFINT